MEDTIRIVIEHNGQHVEACCRVSPGKIAYLTMITPYRGIETVFTALDQQSESRRFHDRAEVEMFAKRELLKTMGQIDCVKQYRREYAEALQLYNTLYSRYIAEFTASEESHKRGMLLRQTELHRKAHGEYVALLEKLIPVNDDLYIINTSLLSQILEVI